jgi:hypothetical protein
MKKKMPETIKEYFRKEGAKGGKKSWASLTPAQKTERARRMRAGRTQKAGKQ